VDGKIIKTFTFWRIVISVGMNNWEEDDKERYMLLGIEFYEKEFGTNTRQPTLWLILLDFFIGITFVITPPNQKER